MKRLFFFTGSLLLALTLFLFAHAQSFTTSTGEQATIINTFLGLPAYPDSTIVEMEDRDDRDSETRFESEASLLDIYTFFHAFLTETGWERVDLEEEDDEVEANYRMNDLKLELELEWERVGGVYELEIDVDG